MNTLQEDGVVHLLRLRVDGIRSYRLAVSDAPHIAYHLAKVTLALRTLCLSSWDPPRIADAYSSRLDLDGISFHEVRSAFVFRLAL